MKPLAALALFFWVAGCTTAPRSVSDLELPADARADPDHYLLVTVANDVAPLPTRAGSTPRGYDTAVAYGVSGRARSLVHALASDYGLLEVTGWPIATLHVHCVLYRVPAGHSRTELLQKLASDPRVQLAQPLQSFATSASGYNDPYFELQQGFREMSIAAAHEWSQGAGTTVAVIDTGVDTHHPDLVGRVRFARNFVDKDTAQFTRDRHGTAVAGIIAAVGNNGQGIVGVAPRVGLLALKACWQVDGGRAGTAACNSFTLALAMSAAIDARVDVINLSLFGPPDPLLAQLVGRATSLGIIVVGAVPSTGRMDGFPAGVRGVLPVDMAEQAAPAGAALRAPGREVLTLTPEGHYDFETGSSLAAAGVSGIVALMRARDPQLSATDARAVLARATQDIQLPTGPIVRSINACLAVTSVTATGQCPAFVGAAVAAEAVSGEE
jgi:subtilisin family serine protease